LSFCCDDDSREGDESSPEFESIFSGQNPANTRCLSRIPAEYWPNKLREIFGRSGVCRRNIGEILSPYWPNIGLLVFSHYTSCSTFVHTYELHTKTNHIQAKLLLSPKQFYLTARIQSDHEACACTLTMRQTGFNTAACFHVLPPSVARAKAKIKMGTVGAYRVARRQRVQDDTHAAQTRRARACQLPLTCWALVRDFYSTFVAITAQH
jgi:hypothetical protein